MDKQKKLTLNLAQDLCLCGSGKLLKNCCLTTRHNTIPKGPATGFSHPRCYARSLNDCSPTISREHYISEGVLKLYGKKTALAKGMKWIPKGNQKEIAINSLTGKVLCNRHNHALSLLDTTAIQFFKFFTKPWDGEKDDILLLSGFELERWMLKMLCGIVASGNATFEKTTEKWQPPQNWLRIMYGTDKIEAPAGLHCITGEYREVTESVQIVPIRSPSSEEPVGLSIVISGIGFIFSMEGIEGTFIKDHLQSERFQTHYRPEAFQLNNGQNRREVHFGWLDGEFVALNIKRSHKQ